MANTLTFNLIENNVSTDYKIYYTIPSEQSNGIKTGNPKTIYIVVHNDEIVFMPKDYKSQFNGINQCREYIESVVNKGDNNL